MNCLVCKNFDIAKTKVITNFQLPYNRVMNTEKKGFIDVGMKGERAPVIVKQLKPSDLSITNFDASIQQAF